VDDKDGLTEFIGRIRAANAGKDIRIRWANENPRKVTVLLPSVRDQKELAIVLRQLREQE